MADESSTVGHRHELVSLFKLKQASDDPGLVRPQRSRKMVFWAVPEYFC